MYTGLQVHRKPHSWLLVEGDPILHRDHQSGQSMWVQTATTSIKDSFCICICPMSKSTTVLSSVQQYRSGIILSVQGRWNRRWGLSSMWHIVKKSWPFFMYQDLSTPSPEAAQLWNRRRNSHCHIHSRTHLLLNLLSEVCNKVFWPNYLYIYVKSYSFFILFLLFFYICTLVSTSSAYPARRCWTILLKSSKSSFSIMPIFLVCNLLQVSGGAHLWEVTNVWTIKWPTLRRPSSDIHCIDMDITQTIVWVRMTGFDAVRGLS